MFKELNARTLADLGDGQGELVINSALKTALADLDDRGKEDGKTRTVVIEVTMGIANGMTAIDVAAKAKLPARRSKMTEVAIKEKDGKVQCHFQDLNAERVDQPTFPAMDAKEALDKEAMDVDGGEIDND